MPRPSPSAPALPALASIPPGPTGSCWSLIDGSAPRNSPGCHPEHARRSLGEGAQRRTYAVVNNTVLLLLTARVSGLTWDGKKCRGVQDYADPTSAIIDEILARARRADSRLLTPDSRLLSWDL